MIIGILGLIGSGKGTIARQLVEEFDFEQLSFAGTVKDAVSCIFNWNRDMLEGETQESREWREQVDPWWSNKLGCEITPRKVLQEFGTDIMRNKFNENIWLYSLENKLKDKKNIVISDVRFPNEIDLVFQHGGVLIEVKRGTPPPWYKTAWIQNRYGDIMTLEKTMAKDYPEVHPSEWSWVGASVEVTIMNNGSKEALQHSVRSLVPGILASMEHRSH